MEFYGQSLRMYVRSESPINSYCNAKNKVATSNYPYDAYDVYELSYCWPFVMRLRTLRTHRTLVFNSIAIFYRASLDGRKTANT